MTINRSDTYCTTNQIKTTIMYKVIAMPEDKIIVLFETNDKKIAENLLEQCMEQHKNSDVAFAIYHKGNYHTYTL